MTDINELRLLVQDFSLAGSPVFLLRMAVMNELLDRLEEVERERDFAKTEIARLHDDIHELTDERDELRAKIAVMERQEPVAEIGQQYSLLFVGSGSMTEIAKRHGITIGSKLYALPGAKGE